MVVGLDMRTRDTVLNHFGKAAEARHYGGAPAGLSLSDRQAEGLDNTRGGAHDVHALPETRHRSRRANESDGRRNVEFLGKALKSHPIWSFAGNVSGDALSKASRQ
jgi:hypothetical protein